MNKIRDERLLLKNLQNIKVVYVVQTFGILCILGYEFFQEGMEGVRSNPLFLLFLITSVVFAYLSMSIGVEHEKRSTNPKKSFAVGIVILTMVAAIIAFLISITPNYGWGEAALLAAILFVCGFIPIYYIYRLRLKAKDEFEEE